MSDVDAKENHNQTQVKKKPKNNPQKHQHAKTSHKKVALSPYVCDKSQSLVFISILKYSGGKNNV